jgi:Transglycosylase SLT domain
MKLTSFLSIALAMLLSAGNSLAQRSRHSHSRFKKSSARTSRHDNPKAQENPPEQSNQARLRLADGTALAVDEAWESEQGIWYRRSGVTYLTTRDKVKAIERPQPAQTIQPRQAEKLTPVKQPDKISTNSPVWIYLTGGARVEADSAEESSTGVWYRHGSLAVFIEHSRIDRVEREDVESAAESESSKKERGWSTGSANLDSLIKKNGVKYGVDPYLIFCVMEQESHFSAHAMSPKGARGLMQLMPGTSARFGVRHPFNPAESISAGTRYLKQLMDQFNGRLDLVLASYNSGEGTVMRYGNKVPPFGETRNYVKKISYRYRGKEPKAASSTKRSASGGL